MPIEHYNITECVSNEFFWITDFDIIKVTGAMPLDSLFEVEKSFCYIKSIVIGGSVYERK